MLRYSANGDARPWLHWMNSHVSELGPILCDTMRNARRLLNSFRICHPARTFATRIFIHSWLSLLHNIISAFSLACIRVYLFSVNLDQHCNISNTELRTCTVCLKYC